MANQATADATVAELVAAFPAAFTLDPARVRPLKLGIRDDLYEQSIISHSRIQAALKHYCNGPSYLEASKEGATRIDLAGEPAGNVAAKEAEAVKRRLAKIATATGEVPAAGEEGVTAQPDLAASKPGPRRLGLSDLKNAGVARKGI